MCPASRQPSPPDRRLPRRKECSSPGSSSPTPPRNYSATTSRPGGQRVIVVILSAAKNPRIAFGFVIFLYKHCACPNADRQLHRAMNTLLIYPKFPDTYWSFKHALSFQGKRAAQPPLGLMTIAALLPASWPRRLVDTNVERLTDKDLAWADVAMISGMHVQHAQLVAIVERCRARGLRTVVGGPITSSMPASALGADHIVIGEAESLIATLAQDLTVKRALPVYQAAERPAMSLSPLPDLSLIKMRRYSTMTVQYSRGCPSNCEFCDIIEIYEIG